MMKVICGIAAALLALASGNAIAQASYPGKTVRILIGFSPGVAPDVAAHGAYAQMHVKDAQRKKRAA